MDYGGYTYEGAYGLSNSASNVIHYLHLQGIEAKIETVVDGNDIDKVVMEYNPTHVVIEAIWVTPEKFLELLKLKRHRNREWLCRIHSQLSFLCHEGIAFPWLLRYRDELMSVYNNFTICPNVEELTRDLRNTYGMKTIYLPNLYYPDEKTNEVADDSIVKKMHHHTHIDIACFGAIRPFKNHLAQAMAAAKFADSRNWTLRFHINSTRTEQRGDQVLKNLISFFDGTSHELVEHPWMHHCDLLKVIKTMNMGMAVSFSETFNLTAADYAYCNIPIVASDQVNWLPYWTKVSDSNSTTKILNVMNRVWKLKMFGLHYFNKTYLKWSNQKAGREWMLYIDGFYKYNHEIQGMARKPRY